ncbi:MAG: ABC transporter ATP-binding protein [bacterium]|nr:ABC transporter ATP-binding protein [bacterium]
MVRRSQAANSYKASPTGPTPSGPVLTIDRVSKVFTKRDEEFVALSDISVDLHQGEFLSLVGPSGCGKSTLLKIVAGLLAPTTGRVSFEGEPMVEPRAEIGLMFQTSTLFHWRNVIRNISLPFEIAGIDDIDIDQRIAEVIDLVRLNGFEEHYPRELSGGMQQRVALCRLLVSDPHLMLLDEPFGSVDEFTREYLNQELARITEHQHKTALFVTHNIREAVFLSDRVVVMGTHPGRVLDILEIDLPRPRLPESQRLPAYNETVLKVRDLMGLV